MTVVGVLLGAGEILPARTIKRLNELAAEVLSSISAQDTDIPAKDLAIHLATALENSPLTNCGFGSELNLAGDVECDACLAIVKGNRLRLAAVGAVPDVANPIKLCEIMAHKQANPSRTAAPTFLSGTGAKAYAARAGLALRDQKTDSAQRKLERYKGDTVGVFVLRDGETIVASSSGGAVLKDPGRIGPAAQYGAASFATQGIACLCSGFGEDIAAFQLAREGAGCGNLMELANKMQSHTYTQRAPYFGIIRAEISDISVQVDWALIGASSMVAAVKTLPNGQVHVINECKPGMGGISLPN